MKELEIIKERLSCCPTLWEVRFKDGKSGFIRERWGKISLWKEYADGKYKPITDSDNIELSNGIDCFIEDAIKWLKLREYSVSNRQTLGDVSGKLD